MKTTLCSQEDAFYGSRDMIGFFENVLIAAILALSLAIAVELLWTFISLPI